MALQAQDYDDMFSNDSYTRLGNFQYQKSVNLPNYVLLITVTIIKTRKVRIKVSVNNEYIKIYKVYNRDLTPNILSNCRKIEKAYSGILFIKDFHSLLKRIDVND